MKLLPPDTASTTLRAEIRNGVERLTESLVPFQDFVSICDHPWPCWCSIIIEKSADSFVFVLHINKSKTKQNQKTAMIPLEM